MASLDDFLLSMKNLNGQLSAWVSITRRAQGNLTTPVITTPTLIITGGGRLCSMTVIVAGAAGAIYNASSVANSAAANELCVIPATVGIVQLGMEFNAGLVISPGAGQSVAVTYYSGP